MAPTYKVERDPTSEDGEALVGGWTGWCAEGSLGAWLDVVLPADSVCVRTWVGGWQRWRSTWLRQLAAAEPHAHSTLLACLPCRLLLRAALLRGPAVRGHRVPHHQQGVVRMLGGRSACIQLVPRSGAQRRRCAACAARPPTGSAAATRPAGTTTTSTASSAPLSAASCTSTSTSSARGTGARPCRATRARPDRWRTQPRAAAAPSGGGGTVAATALPLVCLIALALLLCHASVKLRATRRGQVTWLGEAARLVRRACWAAHSGGGAA